MAALAATQSVAPMPPHMNGTYSVGDDGGITSLFETYFSGKNIPGSLRGPGSRDQRTHYVLADHARDPLLRDMGIVIKNLQPLSWMWVNDPDFMPIKYTTDLEVDFTVVRFDDGVFPEETPAESVSRIFGIRREKYNFRAKRYGIGMRFELDNLMIEEGRKEFALFAAKINHVMAELVAALSVTRLLQQNTEELFFFGKYGSQTLGAKMAALKREVLETFGAHKTPEGPFPLIYEYRARMMRDNPEGGAPTHIVYDPRYQQLFKYGMPVLNRYSNAGNAAIGMISTDKELTTIEGMKLKSLPVFSDDVLEGGNYFGMLSRKAEIGNHFIWRNKMLNFPPDQVNCMTQGYIDIFSEPDDGLKRLHLVEMNANCGRWGADGALDDANHQGLGPGSQFAHDSLGDGDITRCTFIGDMHPDHLPERLLRAMVKGAMQGMSAEKYREIFHAVREAPNEAYAPLQQHRNDALYFVKRLATILGRNMIIPGAAGKVNIHPLFEPSFVHGLVGIPREHPDQTLARALFANVFGFDAFVVDEGMYPQATHGLGDDDDELGGTEGLGDISRQAPGVLVWDGMDKYALVQSIHFNGALFGLRHLFSATGLAWDITLMDEAAAADGVHARADLLQGFDIFSRRCNRTVYLIATLMCSRDFVRFMAREGANDVAAIVAHGDFRPFLAQARAHAYGMHALTYDRGIWVGHEGLLPKVMDVISHVLTNNAGAGFPAMVVGNYDITYTGRRVRDFVIGAGLGADGADFFVIEVHLRDFFVGHLPDAAALFSGVVPFMKPNLAAGNARNLIGNMTLGLWFYCAYSGSPMNMAPDDFSVIAATILTWFRLPPHHLPGLRDIVGGDPLQVFSQYILLHNDAGITESIVRAIAQAAAAGVAGGAAAVGAAAGAVGDAVAAALADASADEVAAAAAGVAAGTRIAAGMDPAIVDAVVRVYRAAFVMHFRILDQGARNMLPSMFFEHPTGDEVAFNAARDNIRTDMLTRLRDLERYVTILQRTCVASGVRDPVDMYQILDFRTRNSRFAQGWYLSVFQFNIENWVDIGNRFTRTAAGWGARVRAPNEVNRANTIGNQAPFRLLVPRGILPCYGDTALAERQDVNGDQRHYQNFKVNCDKVNSWFFDEVERGVGLILMFTPIHRDVFDNMIRNNIVPPTEYLLFRPYMKYWTSGMALVQGGEGLGGANVGFPNVALGKNATDKTGNLHATQWVNVYVKDYKRRCLLPHPFYAGRLGGAGATFFSEMEWGAHVDGNFFTDNEYGPSLVCCTIPVGSAVFDEFVDCRGKLFDGEPAYHYATWEYYIRKYSWNQLVGDDVTIYERMVSNGVNTVTYRGTQRQCAMLDGTPGEIEPNRGHHGSIERQGERDLRERGMTVRNGSWA